MKELVTSAAFLDIFLVLGGIKVHFWLVREEGGMFLSHCMKLSNRNLKDVIHRERRAHSSIKSRPEGIDQMLAPEVVGSF